MAGSIGKHSIGEHIHEKLSNLNIPIIYLNDFNLHHGIALYHLDIHQE